ncbi:MAG: hypothetical protein EOP78_19480 [Variovorax sp.]|nr:MAG: hypothetical protein EOP78_19480 [Variovorax sp.]
MKAVCIAVAFCLPLIAAAQAENPWDGKWKVSFKTERGTDRDGIVTVAGNAGTWDLNVAQRSDPCAGRAYPIEVQKATAEELVFKVARSTTLTGCQDNTMRLKATDANTLEGTLMTRPFKMTR